MIHLSYMYSCKIKLSFSRALEILGSGSYYRATLNLNGQKVLFSLNAFSCCWLDAVDPDGVSQLPATELQ